MDAVPVCDVADLVPGQPSRFERAGNFLCVVRTREGVFAVDDRCPHAEASLADGFVDGAVIECWMHGASFDLRTGAVVSPPATEPVAIYPVTIADDKVYVSESSQVRA